jgi:hypothetical protein
MFGGEGLSVVSGQSSVGLEVDESMHFGERAFDGNGSRRVRPVEDTTLTDHPSKPETKRQPLTFPPTPDS